MPLYDRDYMREPSAPTPKGLGPFARWDAFHWILAANTIVFVAQYLFELGWVVDPQSQRMLYPMGAGVQRQFTQLQRMVVRLVGTAAQHGADACEQLFGGKRFADVVVGACVQSGDAVVFFIAGGEQNDGGSLGAGVCAPAFGQCNTAFAGQHPVQQNQIG